MADTDDMILVTQLFGPTAAELRDGLAPEVNDLLDDVAYEVLARYISAERNADIFGAVASMDEDIAEQCGRELASECRAVLRVRLAYIEHERVRLNAEVTDLTGEIARLEAIRNQLSGGATE